MENPKKLQVISLHLVISCTALILAFPLHANPPQKNAHTPSRKTDSAGSTLWVSETTHNVYRVRIEGNTLFADWVNIPPSEAQQGAYIRTECHRTGTKWIGTTTSYLRCEMEQPNHPTYVHWCHILTRTEVLEIAPNRISGRAEALKRFDCHKCQALEKEWKTFDWIPKNSGNSKPPAP